MSEEQEPVRDPTQDKPTLWTTKEVQEYTGWGRQHISTLCSRGVLPHIPGRPTRFVPAAVIKAIEKMQVGGEYGRRKSRTITQRRK